MEKRTNNQGQARHVGTLVEVEMNIVRSSKNSCDHIVALVVLHQMCI